MKIKIDELEVRVIRSSTLAEEIIKLSFLSGPSDKEHYEKIMRGFIENSLSDTPDLDKGIVYALYRGEELLASARIKQDEYTFSAVSIEYVAVKPEYKGQGLGTFFLQGLFKEIKEKWHKEIAMLATGESKVFYEKAGMTLLGDLTAEPDSHRFYMYKILS